MADPKPEWTFYGAEAFSEVEYGRLCHARPWLHVMDGKEMPRPNIIDRLMATVMWGFRDA